MVDMLDFDAIKHDADHSADVYEDYEYSQYTHAPVHAVPHLTEHDIAVDEFYAHGYHGHEGHPAEDVQYEPIHSEPVHHEAVHYEAHYDQIFDSHFQPMYVDDSDEEEGDLYYDGYDSPYYTVESTSERTYQSPHHEAEDHYEFEQSRHHGMECPTLFTEIELEDGRRICKMPNSYSRGSGQTAPFYEAEVYGGHYYP